MAWTVETLDRRVDAEIEALPVGVRGRLAAMVRMIEAAGDSYLREPHAKHLEGDLWELRAMSKDGHARAIYVTRRGRRLIILHAFNKKSAKTPAGALQTARDRAKDISA